jgi:multidrug efflux pump subunit AcrA (membrane-fusion protein)
MSNNRMSNNHMSNNRMWLGLFLVGWAMGSVGAADSYLVPAQSAPLEADFPGFIEADRSRLQTLFPPAEKLVFTWCAENGRAVVPGDTLMIFDPAVIARDVAQKQADAAGAEAQYRLQLLLLDRAQGELVDQAAQAGAQLAAVRAQLAALGEDSVGSIALARAQADLAAADTASAERAVHRLQVQATAGDATTQAVLAAEQTLIQARLYQARAEAAWHIEETRDRRIQAERLRLQEVTIMGQLGWQRQADGTDHADPRLGFAGRMKENQARRSAQEASLAAVRDLRTKAAHEALRDSHDHTPWSWLAIRPLGSDPATARRWNFAPAATVPAATVPAATVPAATGSATVQVDHGEVYTSARGWGWDRDLSGDLVQGVERSWVLVREQATWRCRLPDGPYVVTFGMGADSDWDGALLRYSGAGAAAPASLGFVSNRIAGGTWPSVEKEVLVRGGELTVIVGDTPAKTLRATTTGLLLLHPRSARGRKTEWVQRPVAFIAEPTALRVNGRIAQELAPLLTAGETPAPANDVDPRTSIAIRAVQIFAPGRNQPLPGTIAAVGSKPVGTAIDEKGWNEQDQGNPQDLGAREVSVAVAPADALGLRVRTAVRVHFTAQPSAGIWALDPWLVVSRESRSWVYERNQGYLEIAAQRAGDVVLVRGLRVGMHLQVPVGAPPVPAVAQAQAQAHVSSAVGVQATLFAGEVVTGVRTRLTMGGAWGRVATLIPDGTDVVSGAEVLTLYNPWIEQQQDEIKNARESANRAFQEAIADRRERLLAAGEQRREDIVAEGTARLDVAEARKPDEWLAVAVIDQDLAFSSQAHTAAVARATAGLAAPGQANLAEVRTAARRAELLATRSQLARAQTARTADWLAIVESEGQWEEALAVVGQRESKAELSRAEDRAAVMKSRAALEQMLQEQDWVSEFERTRILHAPVSGRLYWLQAWNDQTRSMGKVTKDVIVWGGVPVAEIVDLSQLSFIAEVPESRYPHVQVDQVVTVIIPSLGDLRLLAAITRIGQAVVIPRDARAAGDDAPIADQRVFTVTVALTLPPEQRGRLMPGIRGLLELSDPPSASATSP